MAQQGSTGRDAAKKPERQRLGQAGEDAAARHLELAGYAIVARNYRCTLGEIDLIAEQNGYLVFVEVKTRSRRGGYHPSLAVTAAKRERLRRLGEHYLQHEATADQRRLQPRFDVMSLVLRNHDAPGGMSLEHVENAF